MSDESEDSDSEHRDKSTKISRKIQVDFEKHRREHSELKKKFLAVLEENQQLQKRLEEASRNRELFLCQAGSSKNEPQMVEKLRAQIKTLTEEKRYYEELWSSTQRTVAALETEVENYRRKLSHPGSLASVKQEYLKNLKEMEVKVKEINRHLLMKTKESEEMGRKKLEAEAKLKDFEAKFGELAAQKQQIHQKCLQSELHLTTAKAQIATLTKEKAKLQSDFEKTANVMQEHKMRHAQAVAKVNEALALTESAIAEKESCLMRERDIREECDYLARTIGEVMNDAAKRTEEEFETMRREHKTEVDRLCQVASKNKFLIETQGKKLKEAEGKIQELEENVRALSKTNMALDSDLQRASQTIVELEMSVKTLEKVAQREQAHSNEMLEKLKRLQEIVEDHKSMKVQWKQIMLDVTSKFQRKTKELSEQKRHLQDENQRLQQIICEKNFT